MTHLPDEPRRAALKRDLGVFGATMMGLGSIIGTGVFVSIGLAAGIAGPAVVIALLVAAALALCNALSSAQLAANHPVSGGTYEYGYRELSPWLGFTAGWMFLCAKTASAATAALGFAGYLLRLGVGDAGNWLSPVALIAVVGLTLLLFMGIRRTSLVNIAIVSLTMASLVVFVVAGLPHVLSNGAQRFMPIVNDGQRGLGPTAANLLHASALMFVAYTGYGRIATLGEEVRQPRRTIPRAIIAALLVSAALYIAVAIVAVGTLGAEEMGLLTQSKAAPLEAAAATFAWPPTRWIVAIGAMTAMLGVLLNLMLGLSRVLLAMARRRDMPSIAARLNPSGTTPTTAVAIIGILIGAITLLGDVKSAWSFSAFTVLVYYAITNLAALHLKPQQRLYSSAFAWAGLIGCLFLAFWIQWQYWLLGLMFIAVGLIWHAIARQLVRNADTQVGA